MKGPWTFLIFPATIVLVISPLVVIVQHVFFPRFNISGFGGPWGVPYVLLFWSTPVYLAAFAVAQGLMRQYRRMAFGIAAFVAWGIVAMLTIWAALACMGGGCGQSKIVETIEEAASMVYLVFLSWLAHQSRKPSSATRSTSAL